MSGKAESESKPCPIVQWDELTHECLINILTWLSLADRWTGPMFVCKSWLRASQDPTLHTKFDLEPHFDSAAESACWWTTDFGRKIDAIIRSVTKWSNGSLTEIRVRHCSDHSLYLVAERCPNLQVLSIKSSPNVTDASMTSIAFRCPLLMELDISYCYELSHESLVAIGRNCPKLTILKRNLMNWLDPSQYAGLVPNDYLNSCPQDGDLEAAAIGKNMPHLKHLELRFSRLSGRGLLLISEGCPYLEHLDLFGCPNLTSRDISNLLSDLKNLKKVEKPNFYIPRSVFHTERYGHWRLYDERFQTDVFRI